MIKPSLCVSLRGCGGCVRLFSLSFPFVGLIVLFTEFVSYNEGKKCIKSNKSNKLIFLIYFMELMEFELYLNLYYNWIKIDFELNLNCKLIKFPFIIEMN